MTDRHIPQGLGTKEDACSIAAINLALNRKLTDNIPDCMSMVIGKWIIRVQDSMPDSMRNSERWRKLLPLAAGTGRDPEQEKARLALIMDWMWSTVLPTLQPLAEKYGFGPEWLAMCKERTAETAHAAADAADAAAAATAWAEAAARAARAADAAARATAWAEAAARAAAAATAARATDAAMAAWAADAAARATAAAWAARAALDAADAWAWKSFDPCGLLEKLIELPEERA